MKAIGVGCFWFAAKGDQADFSKYEPTKHLANIRTALEGIDNVSNVIVSGDGDSTLGDSFSSDEHDGKNYFPLMSNVMVGFDVFMPRKLQEKYHQFFPPEMEAEHFRITIWYKYHMPVAFIDYEIVASKSEISRWSPSASVVFIRNYLEERLANDPWIQFQYLGPSPLHADVFVERLPVDDTETYEDLTERAAGYRTLYFGIPADDSAGALLSFIKRYQTILGIYYSVVRYRNSLLHLSIETRNGVEELFQQQRNRIRGVFKRLRQARSVDVILEALLGEQLTRAELNQFVAEAVRDEEISTEDAFFGFIDREQQDVSPMPGADIREILRTVEDRRRGYFENLATILSGFAGAILGAAIGSILTFYLTTAHLAVTHFPPPANTQDRK